ncbi:hypothetical protein Pan54_14780 [Rubinisphaera italica]|uniref:Uncharacterized protein n=1 Tax=Rubinisphaera italica TaxID=2527969 RepID=A0A5C5XEC0_9PLAN|nr:hypothetical protein Pan54_14780 [Rubinisphaera italica]
MVLLDIDQHSRQTAQQQRLKTNRALSCQRCEDLIVIEC